MVDQVLTNHADQIIGICEQALTGGLSESRVRNESAVPLLCLLGVRPDNIWHEFECSRKDKVDLVARLNNMPTGKSFAAHPKEPEIVVEVKNTGKNLAASPRLYAEAVSQLHRYLKTKECKSAFLGLIFNGCHVQAFRKHQNLIYPVTGLMSVARNELSQTLERLQEAVRICNSSMGTIITAWNNKGGVGKTTTAQSLGILLSSMKRSGTHEKHKVLLIDYDHNQGDLTSNFGFAPSQGDCVSLLSLVAQRKLTTEAIKQAVVRVSAPPAGLRSFSFELDLLRADAELNAKSADYRTYFTSNTDFPLWQLCRKLASTYDYVIIDAPPNYEQSIFSREAVIAADCILPVSLFLEQNSYRNYIHACTHHLRQAQSSRQDGRPYSLPLWINRWKGSSVQESITEAAIDELLNQVAEKSPDLLHELTRIFLRDTNNKLSRRIPDSPDVAKAIMDSRRLPGVVRFVRARNAYSDLLKEFVDQS